MAIGGTPKCPHCGKPLYGGRTRIDPNAVVDRISEYDLGSFDLEAMWDVPPLTFDIKDFETPLSPPLLGKQDDDREGETDSG